MQRKTRTAAKMTKLAERRAKAVEMRKDCFTLHQIAEVLGCSHETVRNDLKAGLQQFHDEMIKNVAIYRAMQVARREEVLNAHKPVATDPDHEKCVQSATIVDKNETALSKLMGTDQPTQIESKTEHAGEVKLPAMFVVHEPEVMPNMEGDDGDDQSTSGS